MIRKALIASTLAYLASFLIMAGIAMLESKVEWKYTNFREYRMLAAWIALVMVATFGLVVFPVFCWCPAKLRKLNPILKGLVGAASGGIIFLSFGHSLLQINGVLIAAITSGTIIGLMVPKQGIAL